MAPSIWPKRCERSPDPAPAPAMGWSFDLLEMALATSPFWLLVAGWFARSPLARLMLLGGALYAALVLALAFWLGHDCGPGGVLGFSSFCSHTPRWLAEPLNTPVILGLIALPVLVVLVAILALIAEVLFRCRA